MLMQFPILKHKSLVPAIVVMAIAGITGLVISLQLLPGWPMIGLVLLLLLTTIYALFASDFTPMLLRFGVMVYAVTTALMVVAQRNPALMGEFSFGTALGPFFNNVGLLLGLPWFVLIICSFPIAQRLSENIYLRALFGALLFIVPATFMMYNAETLNFFYWENVFPPVQAFLVWFAVAFFLHFAGVQLQVKSEHPAALALYITWFAFNVLLFVLRFLLKN